MPENIIQVDEKDHVIGPVERLIAHKGDGILHRGLMVLVKDNHKRILMTQRSEQRPDLNFPPPFPGFWDLTMAGHPRWGQEDYVSQMVVELNEELGIEAKVNDIDYVGKFQYHSPDPTYPNATSPPGFRLSEFEICGVGVLKTDQKPKLNLIELKDHIWMENEKLLQEMRSLKMAPWAIIMLEKFPDICK